MILRKLLVRVEEFEEIFFSFHPKIPSVPGSIRRQQPAVPENPGQASGTRVLVNVGPLVPAPEKQLFVIFSHFDQGTVYISTDFG